MRHARLITGVVLFGAIMAGSAMAPRAMPAQDEGGGGGGCTNTDCQGPTACSWLPGSACTLQLSPSKCSVEAC